MEHIFLTYDEAATRLGIKPDSVRRRARARKWPRRQGNDGKTQVGIPADLGADVGADMGADTPPGLPPGAPADTETAELRVENRMLRERLDELRSDRDAWREQAERLSEARQPVGILGRIFGRG